MEFLTASTVCTKAIRLGVLVVFFISCKQGVETKNIADKEMSNAVGKDTIALEIKQQSTLKSYQELEVLNDTTFIRLADYSDDFAYDMRYATENNFLKAKVYDCAECYTRVKTAKALLKANAQFKTLGYRILFYDCYRPNDVQYKMWALVPNPQYVANPVKGSIHNKGGAVDIGLQTLSGELVAMGTDFDFFGKRAYHDFTDLPKEILEHRRLLKEIMETHGFWSIRTEWWHYNLASASNDAIANFKWDCIK